MGEPRRRESGLVTETREHVRVLTLDRPERRNALSSGLQADLVEELLDCAADIDVRAVVLTGNGPAFCAGFDLKEIREHDQAGDSFRPPMNRPGRNLFEVLTETYVPVIAALTGHAVAGGFELALACDIRIAAPGIKLGLPEATIGMGANYGSVVLPKRIPTGIALELLFTGEYVTSEDAVRWGLVNRVVPAGQAFGAAMGLAQRIASRSAVAVRMGKRAFNRQLGLPLPDAYEAASAVMVENLLAEDATEGIGAFIGKRQPVWRHR